MLKANAGHVELEVDRDYEQGEPIVAWWVAAIVLLRMPNNLRLGTCASRDQKRGLDPFGLSRLGARESRCGRTLARSGQTQSQDGRAGFDALTKSRSSS